MPLLSFPWQESATEPMPLQEGLDLLPAHMPVKGGGGEGALWVKSLLQKCRNLSSDTQHICKSHNQSISICHPDSGSGKGARGRCL